MSNFFFGAFFIVGGAGWIINIVQLFLADWSAALTIEVTLRIIGIPFAPLGAIMGLFVW